MILIFFCHLNSHCALIGRSDRARVAWLGSTSFLCHSREREREKDGVEKGNEPSINYLVEERQQKGHNQKIKIKHFSPQPRRRPLAIRSSNLVDAVRSCLCHVPCDHGWRALREEWTVRIDRRGFDDVVRAVIMTLHFILYCA